MISDLWTVIIKEWREYFAPGGSRRGGLLSLLIFAGLFGVFFPFEFGRELVTSFLPIFFYGITLPLSMVMGIIADSIAGERERHTLETLLASRLSDRTIILGKLGAAVGYSWTIAGGTSLVAIVVVNLKAGGPFQFYPSDIFVTIVVVSLLVALLYSGIGGLLSLRASTVRQVQQMLSVGFFLVFLVPLIVFQALPTNAKEWAQTHGTQVAFIVGGVLVVADLILVTLAIVRFQRSRLILS
jgi:ABC-2 type transport system permease protein